MSNNVVNFANLFCSSFFILISASTRLLGRLLKIDAIAILFLKTATGKWFYFLADYTFSGTMITFLTSIRTEQYLKGIWINDAEIALRTPTPTTVVIG